VVNGFHGLEIRPLRVGVVVPEEPIAAIWIKNLIIGFGVWIGVMVGTQPTEKWRTRNQSCYSACNLTPLKVGLMRCSL
jgi:hypothetical protein